MLERFHRDDDSSDEDSLEDDLDMAFTSRLGHVRSMRYLLRGSYPKWNGSKEIVAEDLQEKNNSDGERPWLTAEDFKWKYRVDRESFWLIHDLIKDHDVFKQKGPRGRPQTDVKTQLCVFLRFLGTEGSGASNHGQRSTFRVSYGFAARCRKRVARAICSLASQYVSWPDEQERKQITKAIFELSQLSNCIGIIDGTLFPLYAEPQCEDAPDYSGRKFPYSISTLIINDHKRRIRHYLAGFPGTSHDND
jgi:hypothetical protein